MKQPQIQSINLDLIRPYFRNPRESEEAAKFVAESIRLYGFQVPIVVDAKNVIICGHARYRAARMLQLKEVPVIVADDLDANQVRRFRIADNKASEFGRWDRDKLRIELRTMQDIKQVRALFGTPEWDELLGKPIEGSQTDASGDGDAGDDTVTQYEVACPHCGQQNVFKVEELEGNRQKAAQ